MQQLVAILNQPLTPKHMRAILLALIITLVLVCAPKIIEITPDVLGLIMQLNSATPDAPASAMVSSATLSPSAQSTPIVVPIVANVIPPCQSSYSMDAATAHGQGVVYMKTGRYDLAVEMFTVEICLEPQNLMAFYDRGVSLEHLCEFELAISDFSMVIDHEPLNIEAFYERAVMYTKMNMHDAAIKDFETVKYLSEHLPPDKAHLASLGSQAEIEILIIRAEYSVTPNATIVAQNRTSCI